MRRAGERRRSKSIAGRIPLPYVLLLGTLVVFGAIFVALRDRTPLLDAKGLAAAESTWDRGRIANYTISVHKQIDSRKAERIVSEVKDGRVVKFTIDGNPLPINESYTVDGLLEILRRELEMASLKRKEPGQPTEVVLKAVWHEKLGTPTLFKRLASRGKSVVLRVEQIVVPDRGVIFSQ